MTHKMIFVYMLFLSWLHSNFAWNLLSFNDMKKDWHCLLPDPWEAPKSRWLWQKRRKNTKQEFQGSLWSSGEDAVIQREKQLLIMRTRNVWQSLSSYNTSLHIVSTYRSPHKFYNIKNLRVILKVLSSKSDTSLEYMIW